MAIHICISNNNKVREFERILGVSLIPSKIDLDEIQTLDAEEVCRNKATAAFAALGHPVLVDDTGFELIALNGFPGALVTWTIGAGSTSILHRMLPVKADERASVVTAVGYAEQGYVHAVAGRVKGRVIPVPSGGNGFGFDDVFVPVGDTRTFAEMTDAEKDQLSPRAIALRAIRQFLDK